MTDEWVVKISKKDVDVDKLAHDYGFRNMGKVGNLKNYYTFKKLRTKNSINAPPLKTCDKIDFQERQVKRMRYKREIEIKDPLWPKQWHLRPGNNSLNTMPLWRQGIMGEGVTIAIVDDGLEKANFDVSKSYNAKGSYNFNSNNFDPTPRKFDGHGTAAAGCAAAPINGICGVGVAPKAQVSGIRLIADETTDAQEAKALSYQTQINHIFSNSWGPYDDGHRYEGPGPVLKEAIKQSIKEGRGGKGTIYVWASGNGRKQNDNCNYDGYASNKYTIAIGAITDIGRHAFYSEPCAALIACAPSSGGFNSISTCGNNGVNKPPYKDCNILFGGTSASSPLAAGAIALMLGVRPELTWRDVQHILVNSSTKVDMRDKDWWRNEGGFYHNHNYGFGLINPEKAVEMSRQWKTVPTYYSYKITVKRLSNIPQGSLMHVDFNPVSSKITFIEHVEVLVKIKHERKGPLLINLSNSYNTNSNLAVPHQDFSDYPEDGWTYTTVRHWGEKVNQKWTLTIGDTEGSKPDETGTFESATLIFYGTI